jgi:protein O-GlcNAc transferase
MPHRYRMCRHAAGIRFMLLIRRNRLSSIPCILGFTVLCCGAVPALSVPSANSSPNVTQARALEEQGLFEEAAKQYQAILKNTPSSQEARLGLGRSFANLGNCAQASEVLKGLLPGSADAETLVGACHFRFHRFALAIPHLERAVHLAPAAKEPRIYLGRSYVGSGRYDEAIAALKSWLVRNGDDADVLYWIGKFYEGAAESSFDKMAQANPDSYLVLAVQGEGYIDRREFKKAVDVFERALALAPDTPGLHYGLGCAQWNLRALDKAQVELEKELQTNPYHAQANYLLGDIFVTLRDADKAIPVLQRAVALNPGIWDAHRSLGRALVMKNRFPEAIREFQVVADANPTEDTIHGLLSNAYRRSGNIPMAMQEAKLFEKLNTERRERLPKHSTAEPPSPDSLP